jgi:uncharacterized protein
LGRRSERCLLSSLPDRIGRKINPSVYLAEEFKKKLRNGHHFLSSVLAGAKISLIGGESELGRLGA